MKTDFIPSIAYIDVLLRNIKTGEYSTFLGGVVPDGYEKVHTYSAIMPKREK